RVDEDVAREVPVREEELDLFDAALLQLLDRVRPELLPGLEKNFTRREIDHVGEEARFLDRGVVDGALDRAFLGDLFLIFGRKLDPRKDELGFALDAGEPLSDLLLTEHVASDREIGATPLEASADGRIELAQDRLVRLQPQRAQKDGRRELALPVDSDEEDALLVELELNPGAAVRNDLGEKPVRRLLREKHSRRTVELGHDDALGSVDDES